MTHDIPSTVAREAQSSASPQTSRSARRLIGAAWLTGAAFWFAAGLVHTDDSWRYETAAGLWIAANLLILAGLLGLFRLRPHGHSRFAAAALLAAITGRLAFAGGEATSIVQGHDDNILLPVGAMLTVASLTAYGVVVARKQRWTGPSRFAVLAMAVYPLVAMMPIAAATGEPPVLMIAVWGLPTALVGLACLTSGGRYPRGVT